MQFVKCFVIWLVLSIVCYCIFTMLFARTEEYGPPPPTHIQMLQAENAAIRARLTELERNAGACPW